MSMIVVMPMITVMIVGTLPRGMIAVILIVGACAFDLNR